MRDTLLGRPAFRKVPVKYSVVRYSAVFENHPVETKGSMAESRRTCSFGKLRTNHVRIKGRQNSHGYSIP